MEWKVGDDERCPSELLSSMDAVFLIKWLSKTRFEATFNFCPSGKVVINETPKCHGTVKDSMES